MIIIIIREYEKNKEKAKQLMMNGYFDNSK